MLRTVLAVAGCLLTIGCSSAKPIVPPNAWPQKVATGYAFTEGPAHHDGFVYFTDIPNNKIVRFNTATETAEEFGGESGAANGLMFDEAGALYACEGGARRVTRTDIASGEKTVIASEFAGKKFNSPNDLVLDAHGGVYFTDPLYGPRKNMELPAEAVYYADAAGQVTQIIADLKRPNGIILSPDGKTLYVADEPAKHIRAYDVASPGVMKNGRVFAWLDPNGAGGGDGMTVDCDGNLYCAGQGHVWIWDKAGLLLHRIPVPENPANVAFAGRNSDTLYITATTSLYRIRINARGVR